MTKVVIYAKVSTSGQDYERQLCELREYAARMDYKVVKEFSEKISGAKKVEERNALSELLNFVEISKVDKVLIYECSRLSRRAIDFLTVIDFLTAFFRITVNLDAQHTLILSTENRKQTVRCNVCKRL